MKLLFDINVLLDVALGRAPFAKDSGRVLTAVDEGRAEGFVATHTITTVFYLVAKNQGVQNARMVVDELLRMLDVVSAERPDLQRALALGWRDFEDARAVCADRIGADYIVTRDVHDFKAARVAVQTPAQVLTLL